MKKLSNHNQRMGSNLRKYRLKKGLMQVDVGAALDIDRSYISKVETGKARITTFLISRYMNGLGMTFKEFESLMVMAGRNND